jgi:ferrous-iron efflux pump FieF
MGSVASRAARLAAALSVTATVVVVAVKLTAAVMSGSVSVLSEGLQSVTDVLMSVLALLVVSYSERPPDREHPYGHGKAELLASAFQMVLILGTGGFILWRAYERLQAPEAIRWDWGAAAMAYSALSNTVVGRYLLAQAAKTGSTALEAEALHLRTDTLSSVGVLVGMLLVGATGWTPLDPIVAAASVLVAMPIAVGQLRRVIHPLMDGSLPAAEVSALQQVLDSHPEVRGYHNLRTRQVGRRRFIELHVMLDDDLSFVAAHELAEEIEEELRDALGGATVSIHFEPHEAELKHRAREHGQDAR